MITPILIAPTQWPPSQADWALYEGHWRVPHRIQCVICEDREIHSYHVFPFCSCGAGGMGVEHSDHCHLDSEYLGYSPATLIYDDELLADDLPPSR